MSDVNAL